MFKEMRRKDRAVEKDEAISFLNECTYGILSTISEDNTPYGVPLSYVYANDAIYFHCAFSGHKLENIEHNNNVCFTAVAQSDTLIEKFSVQFRSVIAFGKCYKVEDKEEKKFALTEILKKYCSENLEAGIAYMNKAVDGTAIYKIIPEHITGKMRK